MLGLLSKYHWRRVIRYFRTRRAAKLITVALFIVVLGAVAFGIFFFFKKGLLFITEEPFLRQAMPLYVYELFLLVVAYLVLVSSFITSLFNLFRGENNSLVMTSPKFRQMPFYIFYRVLSSCLWPLFIIALPALLAIKTVFGLTILGFLITLVSVTILIGLMVCLAMVILIFLSKLLYVFGRRTLTIGRLITLVALILVIFSYIVWHYTFSPDIIRMFGALDVSAQLAQLGAIINQFKIFPSHFSALTVFFLQQGNLTEALEQTGILFLLLSGTGILFLGVSWWYLEIWQVLQEGRFEARTEVSARLAGRRDSSPRPIHFPRYLKGPVGAVFEKEMLISFRNMKNVLWFGFLFLLWFVQTLMNSFLSRHVAKYEVSPGVLVNVIQALQFVTVVYFMTAFVLRFVFPSFSTEKRTAWILISSPLNLGRVFWAKFLFYGILFVILGIGVGLVNISILNFLPAAILWSLVLIIVAIIFVTAFGLGLGALFPNFETDDPQVLSTSLPGLVFILGSLFYGGVGAFLLFKFLSGGPAFPMVIFVVISIFLVGLILYFTPRLLRNIEFVKSLE